jgi:DNA-binding response OmpR family regulator
VIVVDDNPDITAAIALAVQVLGYRAETVSTGDVALPVIIEHAPTHVLIDLCMPGLNGWDLARRIHARALANPPRLIAITGLRHPVVRALGRRWFRRPSRQTDRPR